MKKPAALALLLVVACASVTSGVKWEPQGDSPKLEARGGGCHVEVYERGNEPERPHVVVGTLFLELNRAELQAGGGEGVAERFKQASCEYGVFLVKDIKGYPNTVNDGMLFEAKGGVWLDENGNMILPRSGNAPAAAPAAAAGAEPTTPDGGAQESP